MAAMAGETDSVFEHFEVTLWGTGFLGDGLGR